MAEPQWWPVDNPNVTGVWGADAAWYQQNVGQLGHNGIDCAGYWGQPIYAVDDGQVVQEGWNISWSGVAGGIAVMIRAKTYHYGLAHMSSTVVSVGDWIVRGQLIGYMGATGLVTGVHVHSDFLPLYPNFNNGYSGRVNPATIVNLQPRGTGIIELLKAGVIMANLYHKIEGGKYTFALAGGSPGTPANWLETQDGTLANQLAGQVGDSALLTPASFANWRAAYLSPVSVSGGQAGADQKALEAAAAQGAKTALKDLKLETVVRN